MSTLPVYNPTIPFLGKIPGGLSPGMMIRIRGHVSHVLTRFIQVNIQNWPALRPTTDINMHMSIRPDQNTIVRNHMQNQSWGMEERSGGCPVVRGQFLEILILAQSNSFKVAFNGMHFCEFNHRLPLHTAQFIYIDGEMNVESVTIDGDAPPSAPPLPMPTPSPYQPMHQQIMTTPSFTPMNQQISGGYQPPSYPMNQPPSGNYPSSNYPTTYPAYGSTFHTPYGTQTIDQTSTAQPHYQTSSYYQQQPMGTVTVTKPKSNNTALKYAAGIGGIGLGAYVLSKAFNSDSDSD